MPRRIASAKLRAQQLGMFEWEHEEEGIDSYTYDNLYFVAQDIDALLQNLTD